MKKILPAFDSGHFSEGSFEFARVLNESETSFITGVFLPPSDLANTWSYSGGGMGMSGSLTIPVLEEEDLEMVEKNIKHFEVMCKKNKIQYSVHKNSDNSAIPTLIRETIFADLLIIGSESFYKYLGTGEPNQYLEDILHKACCPVIVVPEKFTFPQTNILAYNGSESSTYAIKQFAYLFPSLIKNRTILVCSKEDGEIELPEKNNIEELANRHFEELTLLKFDVNPKVYFTKWFMKKKSAILVTGSFGRSNISRFFHKSFLSEIIKDHSIPVFISHHN